MKPFRKIIIITFFIYWGGYIGAMYLFSLFMHKPFEESVVWTGLASAVLFELIYWGLLWFTFKPKIRYIEAASNAKPEFRDTQTLEVTVPDVGFSVTRLREILPPHVDVTYLDEEAEVMKFRTPYNRKACLGNSDPCSLAAGEWYGGIVELSHVGIHKDCHTESKRTKRSACSTGSGTR